MANTFSLNTIPANGHAMMLAWKTFMKAAGWTVPRSSDGTTYNSSGDQITTATTGAGGIANNRAWFELLAPDGRVSIVVQSDNNTHYSWRIKFGAVAFTAGSPAATVTPQTPSSADEVTLIGGGTDASPTFAQLISTIAGVYRVQMMADNAAPYGFWLIAYRSGVDPDTCIFMDPISSPLAGDAKPYVFHARYSSSGAVLDVTNSELGAETAPAPRSFFKYGDAGAAVQVVSMCVPTPAGLSTPVAPNNLGTNMEGTEDILIDAAFWGRRAALSAPSGLKGKSSLFLLPSANRATAETYGARVKARMGDVAVDWDGATTPTG